MPKVASRTAAFWDILNPAAPIIDDLTSIFDQALGVYVKRDLGGNDTLNGTANGDQFHVYDGDDVVNAGAGNDMMVDKGHVRAPVGNAMYRMSGVSDQAINFDGSDNDVFNGGAGNDTLYSGFGSNTFNGGADSDTINYAFSSKGAYVDLASDYGRGDGVETLIDVENAVGSELADFLFGDDAGNQLWGRGGDDYLFGRGGADWLIGDGGNDWLDGGAGPDILSGGAGVDTAQYGASTAGVFVSLTTGTGQFGDAAGDILQDVENVNGSAFTDDLIGNSGANKLTGNGGVDRITGNDGDDILSGGDGGDLLDGGAGDDYLAGGNHVDILIGGLGQDEMWGGAGADQFRYTSSADFDSLEIIRDFKKGEDKIDLSRIDANSGAAGDQKFVFDYDDPWYEDGPDALNDLFGASVGNGPMVNGDPGEVTYRHEGGETWVFVQLQDGDMYAQFRLQGEISISASDFIM